MSKPTVVGAVLVAVLAIGLLASDGRADPLAADGDIVAPVGRIPQEALMHWHDRVFGQMKLGIAKKDEDKALENAWLLVELSRINETRSPEAKYKEFAKAVTDGTQKLVALLEKEEFDSAKAVVKTLSTNCTSCHDAYE